MTRPLIVLSLGVGVQSTTLSLKAEAGELSGGEKPDCAIFADGGAEPRKIYKYLDWLETRLSYPVYRVSNGNLLEQLTAEAARIARPPLFVKKADGKTGMIMRQCTSEFKLVPIQRKIRSLLGLKSRSHGPKTIAVRQWIGISTDEAHRMKQSGYRYIQNEYPLIDAGMSRGNCLEWMADHNYPRPSKSACTFCPYHDESTWRDLKLNDPESFEQAVAVDKAIRIYNTDGLEGVPYLHRSGIPLDQIDFSSAEDMGQQTMFNDNFGNECEGMCGV